MVKLNRKIKRGSMDKHVYKKKRRRRRKNNKKMKKIKKRRKIKTHTKK